MLYHLQWNTQSQSEKVMFLSSTICKYMLIKLSIKYKRNCINVHDVIGYFMGLLKGQWVDEIPGLVPW